MLLELGVEHVIALEPSVAFDVLRQSFNNPEQVTCLNVTGDQLPQHGDLDFVLSIGVLHHIPDPDPVLQAAFGALRHGGRFLIWVYGKEGNRPYLFLGYATATLYKAPPPSCLGFDSLGIRLAVGGLHQAVSQPAVANAQVYD